MNKPSKAFLRYKKRLDKEYKEYMASLVKSDNWRDKMPKHQDLIKYSESGTVIGQTLVVGRKIA